MSDVTLCCLVRAKAVVEWQLQGKTEVFEENPIPVPLRPSQILHGLT